MTVAADAGLAADASAGPQLRLLATLSDGGPAQSLAVHRVHLAAPPVPSGTPRAGIIDAVARAGLTGRGGAGFPTARKLDAVARGRGPRVVVVNGTEGEPASGKDRLLLTRLPHLVLDGALAAAAAVGATRIVVSIDRTFGGALAAMRAAVAERPAGEKAAVTIEVTATPPRFVAGEETALVRFVNGGPAQPTVTPPRPFERGVGGRPTLVQNAETLAHLAQIVGYGPDWFRRTGTPEEPGTTLVTVSGAVARPGVVEVPFGTRIDRIVAGAGGPSSPPSAVLVGGFFGAWVPAMAAARAPFSRAGLEPVGATPGAGILVVLPADACGLTETARILEWYAAESAGQCGPCLYGLADLATGTNELAHDGASADAVLRLRRWAGEIEGRGACRHPDGAVRLLRSAFEVFADDLTRHTYREPCPASSKPPVLHVPSPAGGWR